MNQHIQLELNIDNKSPEEMALHLMQCQIEEMRDSMGKVRRKLFSEMGELKKLYAQLMQEHEELKSSFGKLQNDKKETDWIYGQEDCLFDVREYKKS